MSGEIEWGAEIPVNGKRPEWLKDDDNVMDFDPEGHTHNEIRNSNSWGWDFVKAIRLPADHPYYTRQPDTDRPSDEVPEWAKNKARNLFSEELGVVGPGSDTTSIYRHAFARYIVEHEEAPVDPLLIEAREMFAERHTVGGIDLFRGSTFCKYGAANDSIRSGGYDNHGTMLLLVAALKRGMELAKAGTP